MYWEGAIQNEKSGRRKTGDKDDDVLSLYVIHSGNGFLSIFLVKWKEMVFHDSPDIIIMT